jgi:hypothetical protein
MLYGMFWPIKHPVPCLAPLGNLCWLKAHMCVRSLRGTTLALLWRGEKGRVERPHSRRLYAGT